MTRVSFALTRAERRAIFRGDHRALRRDRRPAVKGGDSLVLAWTRRSRQVVDRETGAVVEIPREPTVWIEFREPELREGTWLIRFVVRDARQPLRLLGAAPSPRSAPGLKTRWRDADDVPPRGEHHEPWTPETERGYVAGGRAAIDSAEAVDDETLRGFVARARHDRAEFERELAEESKEMEEEARRKKERAIRDRLRETLKDLPPEGQVSLLAAIEREIKNAQIAAGQRAA